MRKTALKASVFFLFAVNAFSADRVREFFEWGEYDSLIVSLGNYFSAKMDGAPSDTDCLYFSYLGVAWFAKGDIAEAQRQFRKSLDCEPALTLDKKYVTSQMMNLFSSVKNDREQQQAFSVQEKSIQEAVVFQHYEQVSRGRQETQLRSSFVKNTAVAISTGLMSVALGSLAVYENRQKNANSVVRCSMGSAICGSLCVVFTVKAFSLRKMMKSSADISGEHQVEDVKSY